MNAIALSHVSEVFRIKFVEGRKVSWDELLVLDGVDLIVESGTVLGVIGRNGAGKTTLLKLIAGLVIPDKGEVRVEGKISTLMELGAGFNPELTGRENLRLNARAYGVDEAALASRLKEIEAFASLGRFLDSPVKYYSQGMAMRLGFALAIFVEPDILLIDDILTVGDEESQKRCLEKIYDLKRRGKTIVVVSHDMDLIRRLCDRALLLDHGRVVCQGAALEVIASYLKTVGPRFEVGGFEADSEMSPARIESARLSVRVDPVQRRIQICADGQEITGASGLRVALRSGERWCLFDRSSWVVRKGAAGSLEVVLCDPDSGVTGHLRVFPAGADAFDFDMEVVAEEPFLVDEDLVEIQMKEGVLKWQTPREEGDSAVRALANGIGPVRLSDNQVPWIGLSRIPDAPDGYLVFSCERSPAPRALSLCRRSGEGLSVSYASFSGERSEAVTPGMKTRLFSGRVAWVKEVSAPEVSAQTRDLTVRTPRWDFSLVSGKGFLRYGDLEITQGLGLYTSVRSGGIWHDSSHAIWRPDVPGPGRLVATGRWPHIPVVQVWEISSETDRLSWSVETRLLEPWPVEIVQAGLMLTSLYRTWQTAGGGSGEFLDEYAADFDVFAYRYWYGKSSEIFARGEGVPRVAFKAAGDPFVWRSVVQNSEAVHRARVLLFQMNAMEPARSGLFSSFRGVVSFDDSLSL